ncbi:uncharacterized protein [Amphiura filiformis]
MTRTNRTRHNYRWYHCFKSRTTTPAKFFCAIFYVAICSFLLSIYFWQYPTQPLTVSVSEIRSGAVVRGLKATTRHTEASIRDNESKHTTISPRVNATVNATEVPPTTAASQLIEPKNRAGGGYISVPGNTPLTRQCDTCAVVTSSGHLKGSKEGANIDSADCVIRMNGAPSLNYEIDVGSRTTFRVIGHRNFPSMFKKEESQKYHITNTTTRSDYIVVTWLYGVNLKRNTPYKMCHILQKKYKDFRCYLGTEDTMNRNLNLFYNELGISRDKITLWLSTGWTTMLFALEVCNKIDVYGMVYDGYCDEHPKDKTLYHYYDRVRSECSYYSKSERRAKGGHKFLTEKAIIGKWASFYNITFRRPSWEDHMARYNRSSSIDSPYKRIYHYLQWKKENEDSKNQTGSKSDENVKQGSTKEVANITIRNNKKTGGDKTRVIPLHTGDKDDSLAIASGNETMKSENIMAFSIDGAEVVVVDRETGKTVKVANNKQTVQIKQKHGPGKKVIDNKKKKAPLITEELGNGTNSKSKLPFETER